jgi:outer membrane protein TolC
VAEYNADVATYRQTVLTAFQQVEDGLSSTRIYSQQILRQKAAVESAQQYVDMETDRYNTGIDPYVDVVLAQTTLLDDQQTLNALEVDEMLSAVELVQALGGGWDTSQLPTPAQAGAKTTNADYTIQK